MNRKRMLSWWLTSISALLCSSDGCPGWQLQFEKIVQDGSTSSFYSQNKLFRIFGQISVFFCLCIEFKQIFLFRTWLIFWPKIKQHQVTVTIFFAKLVFFSFSVKIRAVHIESQTSSSAYSNLQNQRSLSSSQLQGLVLVPLSRKICSSPEANPGPQIIK